jgi:Na+/melibiose symporter-like transporter
MLFAAGVFGGMAAGLTAGLTIYFNTYFWELTSAQMSLLAALNFVSALVASVASPIVSRRAGKRSGAIATSLAAIVVGPAPVFLRLLGLFPRNGTPALVPVLGVVNTVFVTLFIMSSILIASMVADIVEDSEVTTGRRSEGTFFAANAFVQKAVSGVGIFTSALVLSAIGFPRGAQPGTVDPAVVRRLGLLYAPALVVLYLAALGFLSAYQISRERHRENLRRLGRRADAA